MFARSNAAFIATMESWGAVKDANFERKDPIGVRQALRITAS